MALNVLADRVKETSTTTGTGTVTTLGAVTGYRALSVLADGDTTPYVIEAVDVNGVPTGQWESDVGAVGGGGTTITRPLTVRHQGSSGPGVRVNFAAGTKFVFVDEISALSMQANSLTTQVLFNNAGVFGGSADFLFDNGAVLTGGATAQGQVRGLYVGAGTYADAGNEPPIQLDPSITNPSAYWAVEIGPLFTFPTKAGTVTGTFYGAQIDRGVASGDDADAFSGSQQYVSLNANASVTGELATTVFYFILNGGTTSIGVGRHASFWRPVISGSETVPAFESIWVENLGGISPHSYSFWSDEQGVFRIKSDNTFDAVYQAIPALYNPLFTKYTPGLANYERGVMQWATNVYQMGAEAGGTGTLRAVKIIGASLDTPATLTANGVAVATTTQLASYLPLAGGTMTGLLTLTQAVGASALSIAGGTQTASFPVITATQIWNNAGVPFTLFKGNVTNTASADGSNFLDMQVASASKFAIRYNGSTGNAVFALNYGTFFSTVDSTAQFVISGTTAPCYFDLNPGGIVFLRGNVASTGGATEKPSPTLAFRGTRWTGAASTGIDSYVTLKPNATIDNSYLAFGFSDNNDQMLVLTHGTRVGIGTTTPSARLHIMAGTATASTAPFKLTSGTNLTTAESGAMEFDGTDLFFTKVATRQTVLAYTQGASVADATDAGSAITQLNALISRIEALGLIATV